MESKTVNEILSDQVTKIDWTLMPPDFHGNEQSARMVVATICMLVDSIGQQSSRAQGLSKVVTSAKKLNNCRTHLLYLLKNAEANNGKGEVIGFLKVGYKHLFVFDEENKVREVEPLCVLDFFVVPDRQRCGYGKVLFDHMLHDLEISPQALAIDGPSKKMEKFLFRNYGIDHLVRQNNNFAIPPHFFSAVPDFVKPGKSTMDVSPTVGRFAAPKPPSDVATVIHGKCFLDPRVASKSPNPDHPENQVDSDKAGPGPIEEIKESTVEELAEDRRDSERPSTLRVDTMGEPLPPQRSPAGATTPRRDSQVTEQGFLDIKFYHNKLW